MRTRFNKKRIPHVRAGVAALLALWVCAAALGCSLLLSTSKDQCTSDGDCTKLGASFADTICEDRVCISSRGDGGPWSCLGRVRAIDAYPDPRPITLALPFRSGVTNQPLADLHMKQCGKLDVPCASPIANDVATNAQGILAIPVNAGFDGYFEILDTTLFPTLAFVNPPVVDTTPRAAFFLVPKETYETLYSLAASRPSPDPNAGQLFVNTLDCNGTDAPGVKIEIDSKGPDTAIAYLRGNIPSASAQMTDVTGLAIGADLPPGSVAATATLADTGQRIGVVRGFIRPGTLTYLYLVPSP